MALPTLDQHRSFLKDSIRKEFDFSTTDQSRHVPPPPIEKPHRPAQDQLPLVLSSDFQDTYILPLVSAIGRRASRRQFTGAGLSLTDLSFLLWATQGVRTLIGPGHALRTVPSAGARHSFETYLGVINVDSLKSGLYRYLPLSHSLVVERHDHAVGDSIARAAFGQEWISRAAVVFIWATVPYRMEWRYGLAAHRVILIDAGHVCQNLYLACEAVPAGTCAVAAYDQERMDTLLGLDGNNEFVIYLAAVGKPG